VPADTPDIPKFFILSRSSAEKFRSGQCTIKPGGSLFRIPLCQLTDQRSVVGEYRGKLRKEEGRNERKKERKKGKKERKEKIYLLTQSDNLRNPKGEIYDNFVLENVTCAMLTSS